VEPRLYPGSFDRIFRAVELVEERLIRASTALASEAVPAVLIGAKAVEHWVATRDHGAVRNTPNVDLMVAAADLQRAEAVLVSVGFVRHGRAVQPAIFLDGPAGSVRSGVQLWFAGEPVPPKSDPMPDILDAIDTPRSRVVSLAALVRMKLAAFRRIDRVHLQDIVRVGLIDATWPDRFIPILAERLREILADPDG
jgi:hypothetical protein